MSALLTTIWNVLQLFLLPFYLIYVTAFPEQAFAQYAAACDAGTITCFSP